MPTQTLVNMIDILMPLTLLSMWWTLRNARRDGPSSLVLALPLVAALLWGLAWSFHPTFVALRFLPPPAGQAGAILGVIMGVALLGFFAPVRRFFNTMDIQRLVDLGIWRLIYGAALLFIGLQGGLPSEFFWSAAIGDIFVGLWAFTIIARRPNAKQREVVMWNIVGLFDLAHVLALGAVFLPTFYGNNPSIPPLNLLPLVGVPLLLMLHVMTLTGQYRVSNYKTAQAPIPPK